MWHNWHNIKRRNPGMGMLKVKSRRVSIHILCRPKLMITEGQHTELSGRWDMNQDVLVFHLAMWVYQKVVRHIRIIIWNIKAIWLLCTMVITLWVWHPLSIFTIGCSKEQVRPNERKCFFQWSHHLCDVHCLSLGRERFTYWNMGFCWNQPWLRHGGSGNTWNILKHILGVIW